MSFRRETHYLVVEGKVQIARLIPPATPMIVANPSTYVDYFRVRINPQKSGETRSFVRFDFADGTSAGLDVRRAVAAYVVDPGSYEKQPDLVLAMSGEAWAKIFLSQDTPENLIKSGAISVTGNAREAARVLNLFDRYKPEKAVVIPAAYREHGF